MTMRRSTIVLGLLFSLVVVTGEALACTSRQFFGTEKSEVADPHGIFVRVWSIGDHQFGPGEIPIPEGNAIVHGPDAIEGVWEPFGHDVYLFRPSKPLTVGAEYAYGFGSVVVGDDGRMSSIVSITPGVSKEVRSWNSCETENCACGCTVSWPTAYDDVPRALITVDSKTPVVALIEVRQDGNLLSEEARILGGPEISEFSQIWPGAGAACVKVSLHSPTGLVEEATQCFGDEDYSLELGQRADNPELIQFCIEEPVHGDDPNWDRNKHLADLSGCSTTHHSSNDLWWIVVILLSVRRRKASASRAVRGTQRIASRSPEQNSA